MHLLLFGYGISLLLNKNSSTGRYPPRARGELAYTPFMQFLISCWIKGKLTFPHKKKKKILETFLRSRDLTDCMMGQVLPISQFQPLAKVLEVTVQCWAVLSLFSPRKGRIFFTFERHRSWSVSEVNAGQSSLVGMLLIVYTRRK